VSVPDSIHLPAALTTQSRHSRTVASLREKPGGSSSKPTTRDLRQRGKPERSSNRKRTHCSTALAKLAINRSLRIPRRPAARSARSEEHKSERQAREEHG